MRKRLVILFTCIILFLSILPIFPFDVSAKANLNVKVNAGFDNKGKDSMGLPVLLTITNKGEAFTGDIVIDNSDNYGGGLGLVTPLEIGANETKSIKIMLDYFSVNYSGNMNLKQSIHIFEGDWKTGKEVQFKGDKGIKPQMYEAEQTFVATFTNSVDRLSVLSNMPNFTEIIHLAQMKQDLIPTSVNGWNIANIIVVDEYSISSLKEEEQKSLLDWVRSGGTIVIGASDNLDGEIGIFRNHLPLTLDSETTMISSKEIEKSLKDVEFSNNVSTYKARKVDEETKTILEIDHHILTAKKSFGKGQIIQTAFSLGDEPLSNEKDYHQFLKKVIPTNLVNIPTNYPMLFMSDTYTNELFPTFQVSAVLLIIVIILYIVIVGPILYMILKKKDKREYAWWIIPALSLFISILVFAYGAKDRLAKPQIQQSTVYEVSEDDRLNGYYLNSFLTNRSGDFTFETAPNSTATLLGNYNNMGSINKKGLLEQYQNGKEITIRNNRYWSVSTLAGQMQIDNVGSFAIDVKVEDKMLKGTIVNNLPYTVRDVSLWYGSQWLKLGTIKPEQTLKVTQTINGAFLLPVMSIPPNYSTKVKEKEDIIENRHQMLKSSAHELIANKEQPALVGWVDEPITPISLKNSKADISSINLLVQSFTPKTKLSGDFVLPANSMKFEINPTSNSGYVDYNEENPSIVNIEEGEYDLVWSIPEMLQDKKFTWTELQLANTDPKNILLEIYNVKTMKYEPINGGRFTLNKNIDQYISENGEVKFKLEKKPTDEARALVPALQLKGEVKP